MSIRLMAEVWDDEEDLSGTTLLIALALADHANDEGRCWPGVEKLAKRARCSTRQVHRALGELVAKGMLSAPARERSEDRPFVVGRQNVASVDATPMSQRCDTQVPSDATPRSLLNYEAPSRTVKEPPPEAEALIPTPRREVWAHYQATVKNGSRKQLDRRRVAIIDRALKARSVDECKQAISALAASSFHNGENDRRKSYLDIEYALGQASESADARIDRWLEQAPVSRSGRTPVRELLAGVPSDLRHIIDGQMQQVRKAHTSQHPPTVELGRVAAETLRKRPTFIEPVIEDGNFAGWQRVQS